MSAVKNPCKGTCSHLCLLRPGGYTCGCPEGTNFVPGSNTECDAGKKKPLNSVYVVKNMSRHVSEMQKVSLIAAALIQI